MKKIIFLLIVVGLIAAGLKVCSREAPPVEVQFEKLKQRPLRTLVNGTGQIQPKVSVDVSADVMGRVLDVPVKEGDAVKQGQVLLKIDSEQMVARIYGLRAAVESGRASLEQARANLTRTQKAFERQANMYKQKLVSDSAYDDSLTAKDNAVGTESVARASLAQAEAGLRESENNLLKYTILSPMTGILTRKNIEPGEIAVTGTLSVPGTLLMTVSDLSVMEVEVDVDEVDIVHVKLGQEAIVEVDAYQNKKWKGEVTEVGTSALETTNDQAKLFRVVITLTEPADMLKPGLSASADIVTATRDKALAVPIQALTIRSSNEMQGAKDGLPFPTPNPEATASNSGTASAASKPETPPAEKPVDPNQPTGDEEAESREMEGVFLMIDGHARFREVKLGITGEQHFEVLEGLKEGDIVISGPYETLRKLKDGEPVREKGKTPDGKDAPRGR